MAEGFHQGFFGALKTFTDFFHFGQFFLLHSREGLAGGLNQQMAILKPSALIDCQLHFPLRNVRHAQPIPL